MKLDKGFTLIELLVVVAIIGILTSVVLAALGTSRTRAQDVAVQAEMSQMRADAELHAIDNNNSYATVCSDGILNLINAVESNAAYTVDCFDEPGDWAAEVQLQAGGFFCVDSTGYAGAEAATSIAAGDRVCG